MLTYGVLNKPIIHHQYISVKFREERPKISYMDNNNMLQTNGIYLFGQSKQPNQVQNEYFIFEFRNGKVIGAFYLPYSSFYCFYGFHQQKSLQVKVIDSYDDTASDYIVDLTKYYSLTEATDNDFRVLKTCRTNYQHLVW